MERRPGIGSFGDYSFDGLTLAVYPAILTSAEVSCRETRQPTDAGSRSATRASRRQGWVAQGALRARKARRTRRDPPPPAAAGVVAPGNLFLPDFSGAFIRVHPPKDPSAVAENDGPAGVRAQGAGGVAEILAGHELDGRSYFCVLLLVVQGAKARFRRPLECHVVERLPLMFFTWAKISAGSGLSSLVCHACTIAS